MIPFNRLGLLFRLFSRLVYPKKAIKDLAGLLEELKPESYVLDVGSGTGVFIGFAHKIRGDLKYVSVDPAYGMIRYAPKHALRTLATAEHLPFKDIFDLVLMGDTIHHIDDVDMAIAEIRNCMKPEGCLFTFDINPDTFIGSIVCRSERFLKEPANFYSPEMLSKMLIGFGLKTTVNRYDFRYSVTGRLTAKTL